MHVNRKHNFLGLLQSLLYLQTAEAAIEPALKPRGRNWISHLKLLLTRKPLGSKILQLGTIIPLGIFLMHNQLPECSWCMLLSFFISRQTAWTVSKEFPQFSSRAFQLNSSAVRNQISTYAFNQKCTFRNNTPLSQQKRNNSSRKYLAHSATTTTTPVGRNTCRKALVKVHHRASCWGQKSNPPAYCVPECTQQQRTMGPNEI